MTNNRIGTFFLGMALLATTACGGVQTPVEQPTATWDLVEYVPPAPIVVEAPQVVEEDSFPTLVIPPSFDVIESEIAAEEMEVIPCNALTEQETLVRVVAGVILDIHKSQPECGSQCTSPYRDRQSVPDYSGYIVDDEAAREAAEIIVWTSDLYDIPLESVMATAYQESRFRALAMGSGSECGMWQQTTQYFRWETLTDEVESREPLEVVTLQTDDVELSFEGESAECVYLHNPENAAWQFAMKYHYLHGRFGDNWVQHYNGGPDKLGYQERHYDYAARLLSAVNDGMERYSK